ncbi:Flavin-dependent halogenase malA [Trichinella pseudospiralis]
MSVVIGLIVCFFIGHFNFYSFLKLHIVKAAFCCRAFGFTDATKRKLTLNVNQRKERVVKRDVRYPVLGVGPYSNGSFNVENFASAAATLSFYY